MWAPARPVWNQYAYHITNITDFGTVPRSPTPKRRLWNNFRAAVSETPAGLGLPDLAVGAPDVCTSVCSLDTSEILIPAVLDA